MDNYTTASERASNISINDLRKVIYQLENRDKYVLFCSKKMQTILEKELGKLWFMHFSYVVNKPYKKFVRIMEVPKLEIIRDFTVS